MHELGGRVGCVRFAGDHMDSIILNEYLNPNHPRSHDLASRVSNYSENPQLRIAHVGAHSARTVFLCTHVSSMIFKILKIRWGFSLLFDTLKLFKF